MLSRIQTLTRTVVVTSVCALAMATAFIPSVNAQVVRQDDVLTQGQTAVFEYGFNVTTDAAPGYFALELESLTGQDITDLISITAVEEVYPVDMTTRQPEEGATTNNYDVDQATYTEDGRYFVRIAPHNECQARAEGGCLTGEIPSEIPTMIRVTVEATSAEEAVVFGIGRVFFPDGIDVTPRSWKINTNNASEEGVDIPAVPEGVVVTEETQTENTGVVREEEVADDEEEQTESEEETEDGDDMSVAVWIGAAVTIAVAIGVAVVATRKKK